MLKNNLGKPVLVFYIPLLLALLIMTGCALPATPVAPGPTTASTAVSSATAESTVDAASDPLRGTQWQLISWGAPDAATSVIAGSTVTLEFGVDGQVGGNSGCNSFGGSYQLEADTLVFSQLASTLMACAELSINEQEGQYLHALQAAGRFAVTADSLSIWYDDAAGLLTFAPAVATAQSTPVATTVTTTQSSSVPAVSTAPSASIGTEANPTRIVFGPGETSAEIDASIEERAMNFYVLQAQQGQIMSVALTSPNSDVLLSVIGEDGTPLKRYQNGPPTWTSQLPATQDYLIHAVSVGPRTDYRLSITIEPLSPSSAEVVEFAAGETAANRNGSLPTGGFKEYKLTARSGQTLHVQTIGDSAPVNFTVRSPGGVSWTGEFQPSEVYIFTTLIVLPEDGDYRVILAVPTDASATRYDVIFTIYAQ